MKCHTCGWTVGRDCACVHEPGECMTRLCTRVATVRCGLPLQVREDRRIVEYKNYCLQHADSLRMLWWIVTMEPLKGI